MRQWRIAHRERQAELTRNWLEEHREEWLDYMRERHAKLHPFRHWRKFWREVGREIRRPERKARFMLRQRMRRARYRTKERRRPIEAHLYRVIDHQRGRCAWCREKFPNGRFEIDHILPICLGGKNVVGNLQLLCRSCNMRKKALHPLEFARLEGRLI